MMWGSKPQWQNGLRNYSNLFHSEARCAPRNLSFPSIKTKERFVTSFGMAK
jgi:hypothetical protein